MHTAATASPHDDPRQRHALEAGKDVPSERLGVRSVPVLAIPGGNVEPRLAIGSLSFARASGVDAGSRPAARISARAAGRRPRTWPASRRRGPVGTHRSGSDPLDNRAPVSRWLGAHAGLDGHHQRPCAGRWSAPRTGSRARCVRLRRGERRARGPRALRGHSRR